MGSLGRSPRVSGEALVGDGCRARFLAKSCDDLEGDVEVFKSIKKHFHDSGRWRKPAPRGGMDEMDGATSRCGSHTRCSSAGHRLAHILAC